MYRVVTRKIYDKTLHSNRGIWNKVSTQLQPTVSYIQNILYTQNLDFWMV